MIKVDKGTVHLTEQTIKEIQIAIEKAKKELTFTNDPMPDGDMDTKTFQKLKAQRGEILVQSSYSGIDFSVSVEKFPHTQESLGYKLLLDDTEVSNTEAGGTTLVSG